MNHLKQLEADVLDWLEVSYYESASPDRQREMREHSLMPMNSDIEMPRPYRLWRMCERHNELWWPGGVSNQPHILMTEFSVCENAFHTFRAQQGNMEAILSGN